MCLPNGWMMIGWNFCFQNASKKCEMINNETNKKQMKRKWQPKWYCSVMKPMGGKRK
jgi:hypothetical protein